MINEKINDDIINIIISYIFSKCDYCRKCIYYKELINDCIIYKEKKFFVIYDNICIYCLHKLSYKHRIIHC